MYYIHYKTGELSLAGVPLTVVFNPAKKINTRTLSKTSNQRDIYSPIQDLFTLFPNELRGANEFFEQPLAVSSVISELHNRQLLF